MKNLNYETLPVLNQILSLEIDRIGNKGHGVTKKLYENGLKREEFLIYVPGCLKGERINARVIKIFKSIIHCEVLEFISKSKLRIKEDCKVFFKCGSCSFRHVTKSWINSWKKNNLFLNFNNSGINPKFLELSSSPPSSRRRGVFSLKITKNNVDIGFTGFFSNKIINIKDCKILHPLLLELIEEFKNIFTKILFSKDTSFSIKVNLLNEGADVLLILKKEGQLTFYQINHFISFCKNLKVVRISIKVNSMVDTIYVKGNCELTLSFIKKNKYLKITPPPGAFLQPTRHGEGEIIKNVLNAIGDSKKVADLFCGSGTLTLPIAVNSKVLGVDINEESIAMLKNNINSQLKSNQVKLVSANLLNYPISSVILKHYDAVVFNPPAKGAFLQVQEIAKSGVKKVIGVSCNISTFIRDAKALINEGYTIEWIKPIDQFPNTNHIELVAKFNLNHK